MLISHKHKLAFYNVPRNASSSLNFALENYIDYKLNKCNNNDKYPHTTAEIYYCYILPHLPEDYYKCAIISNPIRRLFSHWKSRKYDQTDKDMLEYNISSWVNKALDHSKRGTSTNQTNFLTVNNNLYVDRLFDFNKLYLVENFLSSIFGTCIKIPHANKHDKFCEEYFTPDDINSINEKLQDDVTLYKSVVDAGGELIINPYRSTP